MYDVTFKYLKSGNIHVKIVHVLNFISIQVIFVGLWYKYFNMLILRLSVSLYYLATIILSGLLLRCLNYAAGRVTRLLVRRCSSVGHV